jgi:hypothetical protein
MVDIESALQSLVDHPESPPRPVAEIAARARRRRMRRRSVAAAVAVVALALGTRASLDSPADTTTVDRSTEPSVPTTVPPPTTAPTPTVPSTSAPATSVPPTSVTTRPPAPPAGPVDPFDRIEAEAHAAERGVTIAAGPDGGYEIRAIANGDYVAFDDVDFGTSLATRFEARVASGVGPGVEGTIEVRLDDVASPPFATIAVASTGSWRTFTTLAVATPAIGGTHDIYVTFSSPQPADFAAIDWFRFHR